MNEACHTDEWVMYHVWMSHVTHVVLLLWIVSRPRLRRPRSPSNMVCHVTHVNTYKWVMYHLWICHVPHMNEACHMDEWVVPHMWMSHVTHMNGSCHTCIAVIMNGHMFCCYRVATISRLLKNIGLYCKRALLKRRYLAKETYNSKEPTNGSHPILWIWWRVKHGESWVTSHISTHINEKFIRTAKLNLRV